MNPFFKQQYITTDEYGETPKFRSVVRTLDFWKDPSFFNGQEFLMSLNNADAITDIIVENVKDWLVKRFGDECIADEPHKWKTHFETACRKISQPFWENQISRGLMSFGDLLYDNDVRLIRNVGQAGNTTLGENASTADSTATQGEQASTSKTDKAQKSFSINGNFPQANLTEKGALKLDANGMPLVDTQYGTNSSETYSDGGVLKTTTDENTNTGNTVTFGNSKNWSLQNSDGTTYDLAQTTNKQFAYEIVSLANSTVVNLPFDWLEKQLQPLFISVIEVY